MVVINASLLVPLASNWVNKYEPANDHRSSILNSAPAPTAHPANVFCIELLAVAAERPLSGNRTGGDCGWADPGQMESVRSHGVVDWNAL